jgi:hypothetical protein
VTALGSGRSYLAGFALGCLAYKPQLGFVAAIALAAGRDYRALAGGATMVAIQLGIGWLAVGSAGLQQYFHQLWTLAGNLHLIQIYPSEVHSLRGGLQLLIDSAPVLRVLGFLGLCLVMTAAVRSWLAAAPASLRLGAVMVATVLASPHLLTYDLLLLTLPVMAGADWIVRNRSHRWTPMLILALSATYFAPFSSNIARLIPVQLSVLVLVSVLWLLYTICTGTDGLREREGTVAMTTLRTRDDLLQPARDLRS